MGILDDFLGRKHAPDGLPINGGAVTLADKMAASGFGPAAPIILERPSMDLNRLATERAKAADKPLAGMGDVKLAEHEDREEPAAPAVKPKPRGGGLSVGKVGAQEGFTPAASLAGLAPKDAAATGGISELTGTSTKAAPELSQDEKDAAEMKATRAEAAKNANYSHLGGMFDKYGRMVLGKAADGAAFEDGERLANKPVEDLVAARAESEKTKMKQEAASLKDPTSEASKRFQKAIAATMPGVFSEEALSTLTAADSSRTMDMGKLHQEARARAEALKAQEAKDIRDRSSIESEGAANRKNQLILKSMDNKADLARASLTAGAGAKGASRSGEVAPGYSIGNIPVPEPEQAKFRSAVAEQKKMEGAAAELKALVAQHGPTATGATSKRMGELVSQMKVGVKNLAQLGALSGSDYDLINDQIPDPTKWTATRWTDHTGPMLDQFIKGGQRNLSAQAESMGLQRSQPASSVSAPKGTVHMVNRKTGEQLFVQAGDVAHAKSDGFQEG